MTGERPTPISSPRVVPRVAYRLEEAAESAGVSKDTLRDAIRKGFLRAKRTGAGGTGIYLITPAALEAWVDQLEDA